MCAAKSPISILQEVAQSKYLPLPRYEVFQEGSGFKCIATFGKLATSAIAESKKRAKIMCAERLLDLLRADLKTEEIVYFKEQYNPLHTIAHVSQNDFVNYIGKLNELCSQKGQPYPDYKEMGVENMKFVCLCTHKSYTTKGVASTKKQAKQLAAKDMLNSISLSGFDMSHAASSTKIKDVDEDYIVSLAKELSLTYRKSDMPAKSFAQYNNCIFPVLQKSEPESEHEDNLDGTDEASDYQPEEVTQEGLKQELLRKGIRFSITVFQDKPLLILILKTEPTEEHPAFTFLGAGDSYKEAEMALLKTTVKNMKYILKYIF